MANVKQPSFKPTNKLTAALIAGAAYEFVQPAIARGLVFLGNLAGIDWQLGSSGDLLLQFGVMAIAGYFIKDAPNVVPAEPQA